MDKINTRSDLLGKLLDMAVLRHQILAQNVANVNTAGYHRLDINLHGEFQRVLRDHLDPAAAQTKVTETPTGPERADGNDVDIDNEMGQLEKNTLLFNVCTQLLVSRVSQLRSAIAGR